MGDQECDEGGRGEIWSVESWLKKNPVVARPAKVPQNGVDSRNMTYTADRKTSPPKTKGRRPVRPSISHDADLSQQFAALTKNTLAAGNDLLSAALAEPRRETCRLGVQHAIRHGITPETFAGEDQSLIFQAMLATAPEYSIGLSLRLARRLLQNANLWDETAPRFWRNGMWSDASLVDLADQWPGSSAVPMFAHRLIELRRRLEKVEQHYNYCQHLLDGEVAG